MKFINKANEPAEFTEWKKSSGSRPPFRNWRGRMKNRVKASLQSEQGGICCYCEIGLQQEDSHIEHLRPVSDEGVDPYEYSNMLCSCQKIFETGAPRHCGGLKDRWYDPALFVTPLQQDCEKRFAFTGDGHIRPFSETDQAAAVTIEKLGLDIPILVARRKGALEPYLDPAISHEELATFVSKSLEKSADGSFSPFYTTIRYLFGGLSSS
jgi:uncharacterized protein (TIGR02646 family)